MEPRYVEPSGDVFETKDEVVVTVDLQGAIESSILVEPHENYVLIQAQKNIADTQQPKGNTKQRSVPCNYRIMIDLCAIVKTATMKKTFHNGVLELRFKKAMKR